MSSISTKLGDKGETKLIGGVSVSKASLRVESYGNVDELNSAIGFARSICPDKDLAELALKIQRQLFQVAAMLATPPEKRQGAAPLAEETVEFLTGEVHKLESIKELVMDWSVPGGTPAGAAFDLARTVCRRAERSVVRLQDTGEPTEAVVISYLNRLSDLLWLFGRKLDVNSGEETSLRNLNQQGGSRWSRAW